MILLATLLPASLLTSQAPATAADFFPLVPGERRVYESKTADGKVTLIDEVGAKPALFDGGESIPIVQKSQFNQILSTTYYRIEDSTVAIVGYAEDRTTTPKTLDGSTDLSQLRTKKSVLLQLSPAMPVFKYDGKPTVWTYAEVPLLKAFDDDQPIKTDPTMIKGDARPGPVKTVLGRKVETLQVRAEVQLGEGALAQKIVETSTYGRGIGLIEAIRKETGGGSKPKETRTTLIGLEKKEGDKG